MFRRALLHAKLMRDRLIQPMRPHQRVPVWKKSAKPRLGRPIVLCLLLLAAAATSALVPLSMVKVVPILARRGWPDSVLDFAIYTEAVLWHWQTFLTGGVVTAAVMVYERLVRPMSTGAFRWTVLVFFLIAATFSAWRERYVAVGDLQHELLIGRSRNLLSASMAKALEAHPISVTIPAPVVQVVTVPGGTQAGPAQQAALPIRALKVARYQPLPFKAGQPLTLRIHLRNDHHSSLKVKVFYLWHFLESVSALPSGFGESMEVFLWSKLMADVKGLIKSVKTVTIPSQLPYWLEVKTQREFSEASAEGFADSFLYFATVIVGEQDEHLIESCVFYNPKQLDHINFCTDHN